MDDWTPIFVAAAGSAVIAALVAGGFQLWADARRRKHEEKKGTRAAHAAARDQLLPRVVGVIAFLDEQIRREAEDRVGYTIAYHPGADPEISSWNDALAVLRLIALVHPTEDVRQKADRLRQRIQSVWVDPDHTAGGWEQLHEWSEQLETLARAMHA